MSEKTKKEDLRITRTRMSIHAAFLLQLSRRRFAKLTVNELCAEAMISRTAFYAHYTDKHDLLKHWLAEVRAQHSSFDAALLLELVTRHSEVLLNLIDGADELQRTHLRAFAASMLGVAETALDDVTFDFVLGGVQNVVRSHFSGAQTSDDAEQLYKVLRKICG